MERYVLFVVGIILLGVGVLFQMYNWEFELLPSNEPPTIYYSFPSNDSIVSISDLTSFLCYPKDADNDGNDIVSVIYEDNQGNSLTLTLTNKYYDKGLDMSSLGDIHPTDGKITKVDVDYVTSLMGVKVYDENYDPKADFNHDGLIDGEDVAFINKNLGLQQWVMETSSVLSLTPSTYVYFTFSVTDTRGHTVEYEGKYYYTGIAENELKGKWYVNGKEVQQSDIVILDDTHVDIKFICESTLDYSTVIVRVNDDELPHISENVWSGTVTVDEGEGALNLIAYTSDWQYANQIVVNYSMGTPRFEPNMIGVTLIFIGITLIIFSFIVKSSSSKINEIAGR